jgi:hypothetical protein
MRWKTKLQVARPTTFHAEGVVQICVNEANISSSQPITAEHVDLLPDILHSDI